MHPPSEEHYEDALRQPEQTFVVAVVVRPPNRIVWSRSRPQRVGEPDLRRDVGVQQGVGRWSPRPVGRQEPMRTVEGNRIVNAVGDDADDDSAAYALRKASNSFARLDRVWVTWRISAAATHAPGL